MQNITVNLHQLVLATIHNSYNSFISKKQEKRSTGLLILKNLVFSFIFSFFSFPINAQDTIVSQESIIEKTNLTFQEYFFNALTEKSIRNYKKAIENLEQCNQLIPNNKTILFELSKNYLKLNKVIEAIEYGKEALNLDSENLWIAEHLVTAYKKNYNFEDAIKLQEKIAIKYPKKKKALVYFHLQNRDKQSAKKILQELAKSKMLNLQLRKIRANLTKNDRNTQKNTTKNNTNKDLKIIFEKEKSYSSLKNLLLDLDTKNDENLLKYSEQGLVLFPAQPLVYLMNGKSLNNKKKYKKAVISLQNGIDFVIDNEQLEKQFYTEIARAYKGLGNIKKANTYLKKVK